MFERLVKDAKYAINSNSRDLIMETDGIKMNYNGRFGKGYIVLKHNPLSTRYCICEYWVA